MYGLIDAATIDPQFARNVTVYHVRVQTKYMCVHAPVTAMPPPRCPLLVVLYATRSGNESIPRSRSAGLARR